MSIIPDLAATRRDSDHGSEAPDGTPEWSEFPESDWSEFPKLTALAFWRFGGQAPDTTARVQSNPVTYDLCVRVFAASLKHERLRMRRTAYALIDVDGLGNLHDPLLFRFGALAAKLRAQRYVQSNPPVTTVCVFRVFAAILKHGRLRMRRTA